MGEVLYQCHQDLIRLIQDCGLMNLKSQFFLLIIDYHHNMHFQMLWMIVGKLIFGYCISLFIILVKEYYYLDITPKKIILVGDSAGGNLCAALTSLCIRESI